MYDTLQDAQTIGEKLFPDGVFSVQKVTNVLQGFFSLGNSVRNFFSRVIFYSCVEGQDGGSAGYARIYRLIVPKRRGPDESTP
jgi:hypothetical protein